jgi:hypothetical protein
MDDEDTELIQDGELEQDGELLPEREQMSVIDLGEGGGLAPPQFDADPPVADDQPTNA